VGSTSLPPLSLGCPTGRHTARCRPPQRLGATIARTPKPRPSGPLWAGKDPRILRMEGLFHAHSPASLLTLR
jgi:hypothetical protein